VSISHSSAADGLRSLAKSSVALSFWSPPYHVGKGYEEGQSLERWEEMLAEVIDLHSKPLKLGGFLVINIADILCFPDSLMPRFQASNPSRRRCDVTVEDVVKARAENPGSSRYEIAALLGCSEQTVDRRLNGNNIRGGKHEAATRVRLSGPMLERVAYQSGIYLYDRKIWTKDPAWANSRWTTNTLKGVQEFEDIYVFWKPGPYVVDRSKLSKREWSSWGQRGIWSIPSVPVNDVHEAMFPVELARRVVRLYSSQGDMVIDPFVGSGTTAVACAETSRRFIGFDIDPACVEFAKRRVSGVMNQGLLFGSEGDS